MRKQATGKKRKIYAKILRLLPVTVLRFTLFTHPLCSKRTKYPELERYK